MAYPRGEWGGGGGIEIPIRIDISDHLVCMENVRKSDVSNSERTMQSQAMGRGRGRGRGRRGRGGGGKG